MSTIGLRRGMAALLGGLAVVLGVIACGGVGSGGTGASYTSGAVTGFGSVIVAGVRYDDSRATVTDEGGGVRDAAALRLGMIVDIESAPDSKVAQSIRYRSELLGPVGTVDTAAARLTVLGQPVALSSSTVVDAVSLPGGLADLTPGDVVEVYGRFDAADGRITATRLERISGVPAYKLRGPVSAVDAPARRFMIGGQLIDYSGLPADAAAQIEVGRFVRVMLQTVPSGNVWVAQALVAGSPMLEDREAATLEGRVSAYASATRFSVDGVPVDAQGAVVTGGAVALGAEVTVRGRIDAGTLVAGQVEVDDDGAPEAFELHGAIANLDGPARTFVVRGVTVAYDDATVFEGGQAADLQIGRQVEVRGPLSADGTRIEARLVHIEL